MALGIVLLGILLLVFLIVKKVNAMLALLGVSVITGLLLQMPVSKVMASISTGIGSTLGSIAMVLALGAMLGKLIEENGVAQKIVEALISIFTVKNIQWAVLLTGILVGIPLFYNAGFVVLIPLVFAIATATKLPNLYIGIPMAASLSVTHGFLPPHPGPLALAAVFKADVGVTLMYGLLLAVPIAIIAGIFFPRLTLKAGIHFPKNIDKTHKTEGPSTFISFLLVLLPVFLITTGTIGTAFFKDNGFFLFLQDPTIALLLSLIFSIAVLKLTVEKAMSTCIEGVKTVVMIILIIAAGGAFKQILIDSDIGELLKAPVSNLQLSPLFLGWLIAALFRVMLGSATVAALTASGIVFPLLTPGLSPELMVLAVGAGSLMCSHVNDTGFWMFKEYFNLTLKQTFATWTLMESIISFLGLAGVLLLQALL
ncbi:MAG: gluconate:H+ symporter [Bacteroidota bacterium]|nr:gluconate:H+ symporter [Bacteroidota bacterium]